MSAEENWSGNPRQPGSGDAVLRHPNGSIDIGFTQRSRTVSGPQP